MIWGRHFILPGCLWLYEMGFHTVRGVVDAGYYRFRPRFFVVVDVWKDF